MEQNNQVEPETTQTTDEVTKDTVKETPGAETPKTFTQEEVNKFVEARVHNERDAIAKKLGLGDRYSNEKLTEFLTNTNDLQTKLDTLSTETNEYKTQLEDIKTAKDRIEEDFILQKFNVDEDGRDVFLTLVKSNQTLDKTMEQSALEVKEQLSKSIFKDTNVPHNVVIGKGKTNVTPTDIDKLDIDRLRNL